MKTSSFIMLAKQAVVFRKTEVIANNTANADTPGFKKDLMIVENVKMKSHTKGKDKVTDFAHDVTTMKDMEQGSMKATNRPLDIAIEGEGYFMVQTPLGIRYTRAGNFTLDQNYQLVTMQFDPVLANDQTPIIFAPDVKDIKFTENGDVMSDGQVQQRIAVVTLPNERLLEATGAGQFKSDAPATPAEKFRIAQGMIENSNVKSVFEMNELIAAQRTAGLTTDLMNSLDEMSRNAVKSIADSAK